MTFGERLRDVFEDWSPMRWIIIAMALGILLFTGISLFHTPGHEVIYSSNRMPLQLKDDKGCVVFYIMELGNTGGETQANVRVVFSREAMKRCVIPVSVRNFGVTDRSVAISNDETRTVVSLGVLEPEKRVTLQFLLSYPPGEEPDTWEHVFQGVEPAQGKARKGDPGMTLVGRVWFDLFGNIF